MCAHGDGRRSPPIAQPTGSPSQSGAIHLHSDLSTIQHWYHVEREEGPPPPEGVLHSSLSTIQDSSSEVLTGKEDLLTC